MSVLLRHSIRLARARKCVASFMHASITSLSELWRACADPWLISSHFGGMSFFGLTINLLRMCSTVAPSPACPLSPSLPRAFPCVRHCAIPPLLVQIHAGSRRAPCVPCAVRRTSLVSVFNRFDYQVVGGRAHPRHYLSRDANHSPPQFGIDHPPQFHCPVVDDDVDQRRPGQ